MGPVIGITAQERAVETSGGPQPANTVTKSYSDAVLAAGGIPMLLPTLPPEAVPELASRLDGVLLTGGGDVDPYFYDGNGHDKIYGVSRERDLFEMALARQAAGLRIPTLAICRGMQVLNVALGGSLIDDIPSSIDDSLDHFQPGEVARSAHQSVLLEDGCGLAGLLGGTELKVNSIHHQSVKTPAPGLRVVGRAPDGVIEALETEDELWPLLAVQWHPEHLIHSETTARRLFDSLVAAAAERRNGR